MGAFKSTQESLLVPLLKNHIGSHALLKLGVSQFTYIAIALLAHCMMVVDLVLFSIYLVTSSKALIKDDVEVKQKIQVKRIVRDSIRVYFAPLVGAYKGIRSEMRRAQRQVERHRQVEDQQTKDLAHHS